MHDIRRVPRAQVQSRRGPHGQGGPNRHDGRRRQRCPCAQASYGGLVCWKFNENETAEKRRKETT